jgi:hypothetical protein
LTKLWRVPAGTSERQRGKDFGLLESAQTRWWLSIQVTILLPPAIAEDVRPAQKKSWGIQRCVTAAFYEYPSFIANISKDLARD